MQASKKTITKNTNLFILTASAVLKFDITLIAQLLNRCFAVLTHSLQLFSLVYYAHKVCCKTSLTYTRKS